MLKIYSLEGAWAAGKTSILREIGKMGFQAYKSVVPDIYRAKGEAYSPRVEAEDFTNLFLSLKEDQLKSALQSDVKLGFFDRVIFAPIILRKFLGLSVPGRYYDLAKNVNICPTVFLVDPIPLKKHRLGWPRKHFSFEESLRYHKITEDVIRELGFKIQRIEYLENAGERAKKILEHIQLLEKETKADVAQEVEMGSKSNNIVKEGE
ncbi:MAG: AAA family ATPase [Patescibacteria group bacterium]|nr:AAA family ATPase [Patescibacteria group bacterium]